MTQDELLRLYKNACDIVGSTRINHAHHYCARTCCSDASKEMAHVERDAKAGVKLAVRIWTEFMRLRMTT